MLYSFETPLYVNIPSPPSPTFIDKVTRTRENLRGLGLRRAGRFSLEARASRIFGIW